MQDAKTFADLPIGEWFIFLLAYHEGVPLSTVFLKHDERTAEAEMGSRVGKVRVMADAMVAIWPRSNVGL